MRLTVSMFCTVSWKVGLEGGEETALVQVWVNTDRQVHTDIQVQRQTGTHRYTHKDRQRDTQCLSSVQCPGGYGGS